MVTAPVTASERDLRALAAIVTENRPDRPPRLGGFGCGPGAQRDWVGEHRRGCLPLTRQAAATMHAADR